jgi:hypothetical protein
LGLSKAKALDSIDALDSFEVLDITQEGDKLDFLRNQSNLSSYFQAPTGRY